MQKERDVEKHEIEVPSAAKVQLSIVAYMATSSTMLIVNKLAVYLFPIPTALLFIQLAVSSLVIWLLGKAKIIEVDAFEWNKAKKYSGAVIAFMLNIFTNIKALEVSNVETVIVFRTCTSLAIAFGDWKFLKRGFPHADTLGSLLIIVAGAISYVMTDSSFRLDNYFWVFLYFFCQCLDVLYIKHIVNNVPMTSWGRSFYNNFLALPPTLLLGWIFGDAQKIQTMFFSPFLTQEALAMLSIPTQSVIFLSCVLGLLLSTTSFFCRELITATSYSVVGNMNKVLTVFINCIMWDKHASNPGIISLFVCLGGGALYTKFQQRDAKVVSTPK